MEGKSTSIGSIIGLGLIVLVLWWGMNTLGNDEKLQRAVHYLQTGQTSLDYRQLARQDALNAGIDPNVFERQINQESGFHPNAVSPAGAIGIAQLMPSTAAEWGVDPYNPVASLSAAASAMAKYYLIYQSYAKALACYNAGCETLNRAVSNCGANWRACVPLETQRYIRVILEE